MKSNLINLPNSTSVLHLTLLSTLVRHSKSVLSMAASIIPSTRGLYARFAKSVKLVRTGVG
jgi:hypothetical protein